MYVFKALDIYANFAYPVRWLKVSPFTSDASNDSAPQFFNQENEPPKTAAPPRIRRKKNRKEIARDRFHALKPSVDLFMGLLTNVSLPDTEFDHYAAAFKDIVGALAKK